MPVPAVSIGRAHVGSWSASAGVLLVAAVSPFEHPLDALGPFTVTTVELMLMVALGVAAVTWLREPAAVQWQTPITVPLVAVLLVALIAALAAPEYRANALRLCGRLAAAAGSTATRPGPCPRAPPAPRCRRTHRR